MHQCKHSSLYGTTSYQARPGLLSCQIWPYHGRPAAQIFAGESMQLNSPRPAASRAAGQPFQRSCTGFGSPPLSMCAASGLSSTCMSRSTGQASASRTSLEAHAFGKFSSSKRVRRTQDGHKPDIPRTKTCSAQAQGPDNLFWSLASDSFQRASYATRHAPEYLGGEAAWTDLFNRQSSESKQKLALSACACQGCGWGVRKVIALNISG